MQLTGTPALAPRPARAPRGFAAADRCGTCEGRGQIASPVILDGEFVRVVEGGEEVEACEAVTCEDCDGAGWVRDDRTPAQVEADAAASRARRLADHLAFVAETGATPGRSASCGGWWCTCSRG
jgi:hypothetical protein